MIWPVNGTACSKSRPHNLSIGFGLRILIMAILITPCITVKLGWPAYRVSLKSGAVFITQSYWRQNNLIHFYARGGIVGISQNSVTKIDDIDAEAVDENITKATRPVSAPKVPLSKALTVKSPQALDKMAEAKLSKEFSALKKRFASFGQIPKTELHQLAQDLTGFRNKILKLRVGHLHVEKLRAIYSMNDEIETRLASQN
jgi:hypothetical protein